MTSGSLSSNAVDLRECSSNLFTLADINALKWCKYTGNLHSLDRPLEDPVLTSFANALKNNVLCSWRHSPPYTTPRLNQGLTCSESAKELWLFWYGDDPRTIDIVDTSLKESDHGSWESNFPNEAKVLLFKALHNTLERHLLSRHYVRVGKWFVNLDNIIPSTAEKNKLFFSFAFCLQGESKICLTVDVKQLPGVRHILPDDLANARALQGDFKVILGPYGVKGNLTGQGYQHNSVGVNKLLEDWKRFFPLDVVDDWTNVPEGIEHDIPVVVGVKVGGNVIKCPSHYVLVSLDSDSAEESSNQTPPVFMTPPASPFALITAEKNNERLASTAPAEPEAKSEGVTKVTDSKAVACELVNEAWKDITATKSTKTSGVTAAQNKAFGTNFKADQESFWNLKEPLSRKSCSCTSSSNVSRSRTTPPNRPFGINRPNPTGSQNTHITLANKQKKERERKPVLPFHQREGKVRNVTPASKGHSTYNLATYVEDQNRQPNSQNEANPKSTDSADGIKSKPALPFTNENLIDNINNNVGETFLKLTPPVSTRLSEVVRTGDDRKKPSRTKDDVYSKSRISTADVWKCYEVFTGDPKFKPRLPDDVLDFREGERRPLTTGNVVSMPENTREVFKIETIENKNYQNKRQSNDDPAPEVEVPTKRMRRSSSATQPSRVKPETPAPVKPRGHRSSSTNKSQIPAPSSEPTSLALETPDSVFLPASRGRANSTSSTGSAASPAPNSTSSKTSRSAKQRRQSRKSQDKKSKEPVPKQEPVKPEAEQVLPFIASPPTPRVSLRTEKDLQVTFSDLDNMFDSPDEEEEDKQRQLLSVFTDNHSPPVHHGHEDLSHKTKVPVPVNTGPGNVSHNDLARMFPTPPMLENHPPHSPQPMTTMAPTPPEYSEFKTKTMSEEIHDVLNQLKETAPIFEIPTEQAYLCISTAIPPVKSLPSSRLPPLKLTEDMVYTPSPQVKSSSSKADSSSFAATPSTKARTSLSDITAPILGSGTITTTFNSQSSKMDTMSPHDPQTSQTRPIYDTFDAGEHDSNAMLHANLFLSDSYVNYNSDTNLDGTNACLCITGERKRPTLSKEPIGFLRNNDVCQCGLGIFEREKLRQHTGLFSSELLYVSSCMENMGVTLDTRYCDTTKRKRAALHLKKESVIKDLKPVQSTELLGTSNSTVLVDNLLDQFSSPLPASATSGKLGMTGLDGDNTGSPLQMKSASEVEKLSKTTVDFLMDLKPVIQESLHKAIHWKTWDQLSTVQGPLSLKQLCQVNSKGSSNAGDPARIPRVIVGHDGDWLSVSPLALHHWEKLFLEPYTSSRDVTYVVLAPENETTNANVKHFFRELSSTYETCQLGRHIPVSKISSMSGDGILRIGPKQQTKYGKNVVSPWFGKYESISDGARVKLFAQVCKYELGPFLEKLPLDKRTSLGDDSSKKTDSGDNNLLRQDNSSIVIYIINPFDESNDKVLRRESYYALLRSFSEMAAGIPEKLRSRLVLEIVPLHQVTQVDAYQKTKGSLVSFVKLLKTTAFSVFSRCRMTLKKPYNTRVHTGFWAPSSQRLAMKNQPSDKTRTRVYSPAYILATPTKLILGVDTVEAADDLTTHKESASLLFCCYGLSHDQRWLLATFTDDRGMVMETFVTVVEPFGLPANKRRTKLRIKALRRLWEFCQGITSSVVGDWRLVVGKLGRFSRHELRDWDEVIRSHSSSECTDRCDACSSSRSHARFQSVSVVSLHNELCLRIHLAKVTTAFNNYRDPDTTIVESVTRQRISSSFIVINIENSQSTRLAQHDGIHDVDDRGGLVDNELMLTEPPTEDDDEIPMMPLFSNIFPPSRISHLHQDLRSSSPHERPSSAPMLTDTVTSSFVPIGIQSPHPSQSACSDEQSEQEKNFGFPLAHGRVYTTAPLGPAFKQFSRDEHLDGSSPVVLKAALLLHRVDEAGRQGNHVLSSNTHTNVLRYILEQYDALSWLTVDSVSEDRNSCLPVHYITLSQMTEAFNGLLS
ncbi:mediator of RNA polymerase II transcription subunit 13-like isoform X2 [Dendronephthya gigantea]|uniref:mediator of RNA polymerase II transcription subunit 13-like isoform X2 n=1 Tax=Dendronephthya gigantea TaxID=151771 RepID=UPI00106A7044|nr:mediator of RNA polymerase II transcription subunit 13-like isoform X2 [Dendronephthya gigantea]